MLFWASTGIEAYSLLHSIKSIQKTDSFFLIVLITYSWLYSADVYIRTHPDGDVCYLSNEHPFHWILIAPVAFVLLFNLTVAFLAVTSAYRSAKFRKVESS